MGDRREKSASPHHPLMGIGYGQVYKVYLSRGVVPLPASREAKRPLLPSWREYQDHPPPQELVEGWVKRWPDANVAILQGAPSGNLIILDFDDREALQRFGEALKGQGGHSSLRHALSNTWWVETKRGYHIYLRVIAPPEQFTKAFGASRKLGGVEIRGHGGIAIAPPSTHPEDPTIVYRFRVVEDTCMGPKELCPQGFKTVEEPAEITIEEAQALVAMLESAFKGDPSSNRVAGWCRDLRRLGDNSIIEIKNLLKEAYVPGQRQYLALFLSGWLAKARIHPASAARIIKMLYDETDDGDSLKTRLSAMAYSYSKLGCWSEELESDVAADVGVTPYAPRGSVAGADVKGKSGLQEILEETLGEEVALNVIRRLEEILGVSSPWRDSIIELLDYDRQIYAIANLRKLVLVRAYRDGNRLVYRERVAIVAPTQLTVYANPLGGITKYEVVLEGQTLRRPLRLGPATLDDIIARLRLEGLVYNRRLIEDVLSAILQGMIRKGRAEIKEEIDKPGFYWFNGKLQKVRIDMDEPNDGELRSALKLLDELATEWYGHAAERFSTSIKWGLLAPFSYSIKQMGKWMPWLMLYGSSKTGKTTIGEIILNLWGLGSLHFKTGSSIDSVPRLGHVLSSTSLPILVNEPGPAFKREDVIETMKNAIDSTIVRGRYVKGSYVEMPALAPLIITSNKTLPPDDALLRRIVVLRFSFNDRIPDDKVKAFEERVKPRLRELKAIGAWVKKRVLNDPQLLEGDWRATSTRLLEEMYREVGLEPPKWIYLDTSGEENPYEDIRQAILDYIIDRINKEYFKAVGRIEVTEDVRIRYIKPIEAPLKERITIVAEARLIPWLGIKDGKLVLLSGLARELRNVVGDLGGLRSIAELMGWEYKRQLKLWGRNVQAALTTIESLAGAGEP